MELSSLTAKAECIQRLLETHYADVDAPQPGTSKMVLTWHQQSLLVKVTVPADTGAPLSDRIARALEGTKLANVKALEDTSPDSMMPQTPAMELGEASYKTLMETGAPGYKLIQENGVTLLRSAQGGWVWSANETYSVNTIQAILNQCKTPNTVTWFALDWQVSLMGALGGAGLICKGSYYEYSRASIETLAAPTGGYTVKPVKTDREAKDFMRIVSDTTGKTPVVYELAAQGLLASFKKSEGKLGAFLVYSGETPLAVCQASYYGEQVYITPNVAKGVAREAGEALIRSVLLGAHTDKGCSKAVYWQLPECQAYADELGFGDKITHTGYALPQQG